jgi:hypothetical protein
VPTGIATDATTAPFFAALVEQPRLASLYSFENEEMIFPGIHHATKFCELCAKPQTDVGDPTFCFFARQVSALLDEGSGKYLILPPGYKEKQPEGYIPLQSDTYGGYALALQSDQLRRRRNPSPTASGSRSTRPAGSSGTKH